MNKELLIAKLRLKVEEWLNTIDNVELRDKVRLSYILAGGAIVSTVLDQDINDYDIWIDSPRVMADLLNYYLSKDGMYFASYDALGKSSDIVITNLANKSVNLSSYWIDKDSLLKDIVSISSFSLTLTNGFQLIYGRTASSPEDLISGFDFDHAKVFITNNRHNLSDLVISLIQDSNLHYSGSTYPVSTLLRIPKHLKKGKTGISYENLLKLLKDILALPKEELDKQLNYIVISSDGDVIL